MEKPDDVAAMLRLRAAGWGSKRIALELGCARNTVRRRLAIESLATVRFETPPGKQLQADFGELFVTIGGERTKVHLCVLTLGWSRRGFVQAFRHERQESWLNCMEASFRHFGGVVSEVLVDNARALVTLHNVETGEIVFSDRFTQFAAYWGFKPRACAPYRARTKGKDERGVGYVKRNASAGRTFETWEELEGWLAQWMREIADVRIHGTTGEQPIVRFDRAEFAKLQPLPNKPAFLSERELERKVHNDACVEVDANWYSVPWRLVKTTVFVRVRDRAITITHAGRVVATHTVVEGRRQRVVDPAGPLGRPDTSSKARAGACGRGGLRVRAVTRCLRGVRRGGGGMNPAVEHLDAMWTRLQLGAIRDRLDTLLDEATRQDLNLRETLAFLCEAEVAHKDRRRISMLLPAFVDIGRRIRVVRRIPTPDACETDERNQTRTRTTAPSDGAPATVEVERVAGSCRRYRAADRVVRTDQAPRSGCGHDEVLCRDDRQHAIRRGPGFVVTERPIRVVRPRSRQGGALAHRPIPTMQTVHDRAPLDRPTPPGFRARSSGKRVADLAGIHGVPGATPRRDPSRDDQAAVRGGVPTRSGRHVEQWTADRRSASRPLC